MARRKEILVNGEYYHVYNRSTWNQDIFDSHDEIVRALDLLDFYRFQQSLRYSKYRVLSNLRKVEYITSVKSKSSPLVKIHAYTLMPDHFHFLLKQETEGGIKNFISNFQNAFVKYFNLKNQNRGSLFINNFKAKRIASEEILFHISRYIHLNLATSYLVKDISDLLSDKRTSLIYYLKESRDDLIDTSLILNLIGTRQKYLEFVKNQLDYQRELKRIRNFLFD